MARVVRGLDGCAGGWVAVTLVDGKVSDVEVVATLGGVPDDDTILGVDMPIGLLDEPVCDADAAARKRLRGQASSVFNAPPRTVLDGYLAGEILDHATAADRSRIATGKGISQQSWALVPKIAELDAVVRAGREVLEVHPEVAFAEVAGEVLPRKRSWAGIAMRTRLLEHLGIELPSRFPGDRCPPDDVVDAAICAWVADGVARGLPSVTYPERPSQYDPTHRARAIVIVARALSGREREQALSAAVGKGEVGEYAPR